MPKYTVNSFAMTRATSRSIASCADLHRQKGADLRILDVLEGRQIQRREFPEDFAIDKYFMMRRHICRLRSNENETVFARLCGIDCSSPLNEVKQVYREYSPGDEKFKEDFAATNFSGGLVDRARYCLEQIALQAQGENIRTYHCRPRRGPRRTHHSAEDQDEESEGSIR